MKKNIWAGIAILSLLLNACGNVPTEPTKSAEGIQATAASMSMTIIAETQAAIPTNTTVPPSDTPVPTPIPTDTTIPSPTEVDQAAVAPTVVPTFTLQPVTSAPTTDPCNKTLTSWQGPSVSINIVYDYSPQGKDDKVVVSLWVMTDHGECGFLSDISVGPVGQYSVSAFVDGTKNFKVFGGFRLGEATWDIVIRNDSIVALGSCYPNC